MSVTYDAGASEEVTWERTGRWEEDKSVRLNFLKLAGECAHRTVGTAWRQAASLTTPISALPDVEKGKLATRKIPLRAYQVHGQPA